MATGLLCIFANPRADAELLHIDYSTAAVKLPTLSTMGGERSLDYFPLEYHCYQLSRVDLARSHSENIPVEDGKICELARRARSKQGIEAKLPRTINGLALQEIANRQHLVEQHDLGRSKNPSGNYQLAEYICSDGRAAGADNIDVGLRYPQDCRKIGETRIHAGYNNNCGGTIVARVYDRASWHRCGLPLLRCR